jgi:hypothetical protein
MDKQDYTKSNKRVPPKDAQLLEGPNPRYEHQLTEKEKLKGKVSKAQL